MKQFSFLFVLLLLAQLCLAQSPGTKLNKQLNLDASGVALSGYDAVSYFKQHKAVKGKAIYSFKFQNATYFFSSPENKQRFESNPGSYLPAYGGWCAFAMGDNGEKVSINPETFKIIDGKLYLFYDAFFNNTLTSWNKNEAQLKLQADKNWNKLTK